MDNIWYKKISQVIDLDSIKKISYIVRLTGAM